MNAVISKINTMTSSAKLLMIPLDETLHVRGTWMPVPVQGNPSDSSSFAQNHKCQSYSGTVRNVQWSPKSERIILWGLWKWRLKHFYLNYCFCLSVYLSGVGWSRHASSTSLCIMSSACMRSICLTLLRSRMSATATPRPRHTTVHCTAFGGMHHCTYSIISISPFNKFKPC